MVIRITLRTHNQAIKYYIFFFLNCLFAKSITEYSHYLNKTITKKFEQNDIFMYQID